MSDDLEMRAIARDYSVPASAVLAVEAGCDGVLICSGDCEVQAAALEALVRAVENERLPLARVDDAVRRQRRMKERFALAASPSRPATARRLRQLVGLEAHQAVADEMARFA